MLYSLKETHSDSRGTTLGMDQLGMNKAIASLYEPTIRLLVRERSGLRYTTPTQATFQADFLMSGSTVYELSLLLFLGVRLNVGFGSFQLDISLQPYNIKHQESRLRGAQMSVETPPRNSGTQATWPQ